MSGNALSGHRAISTAAFAVPAHRPKRIDLVVTDYDFLGDLAGLCDTDGLQQEFRCTIPLAILNEDISGEDLRAVAHFCRLWANGPITTDGLLHLIENVFGTLQHPPHEHKTEAATQSDHARVARLTPRERQVLDHVVAGHPNKSTATALNISRRTVEHHRAAIMQKTRTKSVSELVRLALRTGMFAVTDPAND